MAYTETLDNWASMQENSEQLKRYIDIGKANTLVKDMEKEVEKYTKLLELAKQDQVYVVTHNVNYFNYLYAIPSAKEFFYKKDADKRSKEYKENKSCFNYLTKMLNELFDVSATIVNFYAVDMMDIISRLILKSMAMKKYLHLQFLMLKRLM